jgi:hypothetical protein
MDGCPLTGVQSHCSFCVESCVSGDKMYMLSDTINDYHDHIVAIHMRKFNNKVDADDVSLICWSLYGVEG